MAHIESGDFDANHVDLILIKLRQYSGHRRVFREIADFVAHADARTKGVAHESMTAFADAMRFFIEYNQGQNQLDVTQPFPAYVYRLFLSQSRQADEVHLKATYRLSHSTLIKKIENNFSLDKATKTYTIRPGKAGIELVGALQYVMGFIHSKPAFHLFDFHQEFKQILRDHGITFNEMALNKQLDRVALSILCLISGSDVMLPEGDRAKCRLGSESHFRILQGQRRLPTGSVTMEPNSFGTLQILGEITVIANGAPPLRVSYPVISSDLDPRDYCTPTLFVTDNSPNEFGDYVVQVIDFADDMAISSEFKLVRADSVCFGS